MAREKQNRQNGPELDVQLQLQEVETSSPAASLLHALDRDLPVDFLMQEALANLEGLPVAAQLAVLRVHLPELLSQLDAQAREDLARELGLLGQSLQ